MKLFKTISICLFASSLAFAGCKKKEEAKPADTAKAADTAAKPADPAAVTPPAAPAGAVTIASDDEYIAKGGAILDKLTEVFKADGTNCDKLGEDLNKAITEHTPAIEAVKAYEAAHPDVKKKADEAGKAKSEAFMQAAGPAMEACKGNAKVTEAFSKLG